jgi:gluconate 2-dehydrogenase alpha chain
VNFVVVGSGVAGGVVAKELSAAGFSVVVFEQGPHRTEKDFTHDELQFVQRFYLTNDHARRPNTFRRSSSEKAAVQPAVGYGMEVGAGRFISRGTIGGSRRTIFGRSRGGARWLVLP